jgi:RNA polymerase sigma-70 factor (ECF subfamily)
MTTTLDRHDDIVRRFADACRRADIAGLSGALDADAVAVCDGGGLVPAAPGPVHGAADVAEMVAVVLCRRADAELTVEAVNGRAGLAVRRDGRAAAVVGIGTANGKVSMLWIVLNPAKLGGWHSP